MGLKKLERQVDRRSFLRGALALSGAGAAMYALGCGGQGGGTDETSTPSGGMTTPMATAGGAIRPVMLTSEYVVAQENRFLVGLLTSENDFLRDAQVGLKFFTVNPDGQSGKLRGEGFAEYVELKIPASASTVGGALGEAIGFYQATAPFDIAGQWAVEMAATQAGAATPTTVQAPFTVFEQFRIPAPGETPPASRNDTAATNSNLTSLCTRDPICGLHDRVIGDVLGQGRPLVVQFSTPAFCETRFCGPVLDVLLEQVPAYEDRVDFVHIEVWQDFQLKQQRAAVQEWGLPTEPVTFFIGGGGQIVSFLESIFTEADLTAGIEGILG